MARLRRRNDGGARSGPGTVHPVSEQPYELISTPDGLVAQIAVRGNDVLRTPILNRGTAFTEAERRALGLVGLLPTGLSSMEGPGPAHLRPVPPAVIRTRPRQARVRVPPGWSPPWHPSPSGCRRPTPTTRCWRLSSTLCRQSRVHAVGWSAAQTPGQAARRQGVRPAGVHAAGVHAAAYALTCPRALRRPKVGSGSSWRCRWFA
jgi:hypothetical protein